MKFNDELKQKIMQKIKDTRSVSFTYSIYNDFLPDEYIDNDYKPTEKLIFLEFEQFDILIDTFYQKIEEYYDDFQIEYFKTPKTMPQNNIAKVIKIEKNNFMKKFIKTYEIIRDNFGANLQKYNKINICPYCEKNYINIIEGEEKTFKPDLDHFYSKSLYSFLASSVENLIPSCQMCNSRLKGNIDFYEIQHINPLKYRLFDEIKFSYDAKGIMIENMDRLKKDENKKKYLDTFKIEEVYATHSEILEDIQIKFKMYNNIKIKQLQNNCFLLQENEIEDTIFYEYKNNNKKFPLRKLKKDLYEKLYKYMNNI